MNLDNNIFYENQLMNTSLTWRLYSDDPSTSENLEPIISGIIDNTQVGFSGTHNWSGASGGGNAYNTISSGMQSRISSIQSLIDSLALYSGAKNDLKNILDKNEDFKKWSSNLVKDSITNKLQGSAIMNSFDYIKTFKGTEFNISIPTLTTRVYYGQVPNYDGSDSEMSVKPFVSKLLDKISGRLKSLKSDSNNANTVEQLVGIQLAPNEYKPSFLNIGGNVDHIAGSFCLMYGDHMIDNLLIQSFNIDYSTFNILKPGDNGSIKVEKDPLYADISISLIPCNYISLELIAKVMNFNLEKSTDVWEDLGITVPDLKSEEESIAETPESPEGATNDDSNMT